MGAGVLLGYAWGLLGWISYLSLPGVGADGPLQLCDSGIGSPFLTQLACGVL